MVIFARVRHVMLHHLSRIRSDVRPWPVRRWLSHGGRWLHMHTASEPRSAPRVPRARAGIVGARARGKFDTAYTNLTQPLKFDTAGKNLTQPAKIRWGPAGEQKFDTRGGPQFLRQI